MSKRVQLIRHISSEADEFIGREGEITIDLTNKQIRLHDGVTPGGHKFINQTDLINTFQPIGVSEIQELFVDDIFERTGNHGVVIDGVSIKDGLVDGEDVADIRTDLTSHAALAANVAHGGAYIVGEIRWFAFSTPEPGWSLCDGGSLTTAGFPALFAKLGYTHGGAGANFNKPDYRGRTLVGSGQGVGLTNRTLAQTGGEETHQLSEAEMPQHDHSTNTAHQHTVTGVAVANTNLAHAHGINGNTGNDTPDHAHNVTTTGRQGNTFGATTPTWSYDNVANASQETVGSAGANVRHTHPLSLNSDNALGNHTHALSGSVDSAGGATTSTQKGGNAAHNTMPPFAVGTPMIWTGVIS